MAGGVIPLGQVAFVDAGIYAAGTTYKRFQFVTTADSCYLSLKDGNKGNAITNTAWWKCLADGKPATEATALCKTATGEAKTAASNCDGAAVRAGSAAAAAEQATATTNQAATKATQAAESAAAMIKKGQEQIDNMKAVEQSVINYAQIVPTRMELEYNKRITLSNPTPQRITAKLFPEYVMQNTLFLAAGGDSVTVNPLGELTINKAGKSKIYVIPTHNTSLMQTIEIEVIEQSMRLTNTGDIRLDKTGNIRLT